jgi:urea carboxylase
MIKADPGARVAAGDPIVIVESMKMEIVIAAPVSGVVRELRCQPGKTVQAGQVLALIGKT